MVRAPGGLPSRRTVLDFGIRMMLFGEERHIHLGVPLPVQYLDSGNRG